MSRVKITTSSELPISTGFIDIDTSGGPVTLFINSVPTHAEDELLVISKISNDKFPVSLFSDKYLINGYEMIIFGLPLMAQVKNGKIRSITLKGDGKAWKILN